MYRLSMRSLSVETPRVLFDISRLVRSHQKTFATGVDRIDLAIGLDLVRRFGEDCYFVHAGQHGICILPSQLGRRILHDLHAVWNESAVPPAPLDRVGRLRLTLEPYVKGTLYRPDDTIISSSTTYVVASHSGVGKVDGGMKRLDPARRMKRIIYIHDLIPFEFPEYQRPETLALFTDFMARLTDAPVCVVSNSYDTDRRVRAYAATQGWTLEGSSVIIPTLEFEPTPTVPLRPAVETFLQRSAPYFVILGTIEPRKNHLLLLQIWRELAHRDNPPRLCIIGKRGWENENVIDMLERCPGLTDLVFEFAGLPDYDVQTLLKHSSALLFPSFAEGLGIPILEAAALGVQSIVSDIPVFREIAPEGTLFLDPLDGPGWMQAIVSRSGQFKDAARRADGSGPA